MKMRKSRRVKCRRRHPTSFVYELFKTNPAPDWDKNIRGFRALLHLERPPVDDFFVIVHPRAWSARFELVRV